MNKLCFFFELKGIGIYPKLDVCKKTLAMVSANGCEAEAILGQRISMYLSISRSQQCSNSHWSCFLIIFPRLADCKRGCLEKENGNPVWYSCLGNPMVEKSLSRLRSMGPQSQGTNWNNLHVCIGERKWQSTPKYSWLEDPMELRSWVSCSLGSDRVKHDWRK